MQEGPAPRATPSSPPPSAAAASSMSSVRCPSSSPTTVNLRGAANNANNAGNNSNAIAGANEGKKDVGLANRKPGKSPQPRSGTGGKPNRSNNRKKNNHQASPNGFVHHHGGRQPHGGGGGRANNRRSSAPVTQDDEFEVGSVFNSGSKKQNLNHLLNFQFEPRGQRHQGNRNNTNVRSYGGARKRNNSYRPRYNKEQYLQANCQFVVKSGQDYTKHLSDPDLTVDWDLIEQVGLKTSAVPSCPICLYPPTAAKMARCGHIFCWACILHYHSLSDNKWRKCPICDESIHEDHIKSVVSLLHSDFQTGDEIEMRLMRRERNSLFAVPVEDFYPEIDAKHPNMSSKVNSYSQLVTATPVEVANNIIARERKELEQQYSAEKNEPEAVYIEIAFTHLATRESLLLCDKSTPSTPVCNMPTVEEDENSSSKEEDERSPNEEEECVGGAAGIDMSPVEDEFSSLDLDEAAAAAVPRRPRHASSSSDGTSSVELGYDDEEFQSDDLDISSVQPGGKSGVKTPPLGTPGKPAPKETFYFYQASDGQAIFLHALNVQMLVQEYGCFENCPKVIRGKILEKDNTSMTEDLRNKLRYLRHLPVTSNFEVCELQLEQPLVSQDTIKMFDDQLSAREKKRKRRAREEKRREKRIQVEENKLLGKFPERKMRIESEMYYPQLGNKNAQPSPMLVPESLRRSSESVNSGLSVSPNTSGGFFDGEAAAGNSLSFANKLRQAPSASSSSARSAAMRRSETFPSPALLAPPIHVRHRHSSDSDSEMPEGYVPPPQRQNIGDLLSMALENRGAPAEAAAQPNGKGGKKKGKKTKFRPLLPSQGPQI